MASYDSVRSSTAQAIAEAGQVVTLVKSTVTVDGPSGVGVISSTTYDMDAVETAFKSSEIDGTNILFGDKNILLAAYSDKPSPAPNDSLIIGGVSYTVIAVNSVSPGGTAVLYKAQVRK